MDFYTLTAIKFALGILMMIFQINVLGKRDFSLNTPLNQVQNYVLGGIIGGVIYNSSITLLQFFIIILIWSLVVIATKILIDYSKTFKRLTACQPELIIRDGWWTLRVARRWGSRRRASAEACATRASPALVTSRLPSWKPTEASRFGCTVTRAGARSSRL